MANKKRLTPLIVATISLACSANGASSTAAASPALPRGYVSSSRAAHDSTTVDTARPAAPRRTAPYLTSSAVGGRRPSRQESSPLPPSPPHVVPRGGAFISRRLTRPARALVTIWAVWNILDGMLLSFFSPRDQCFVGYLVDAIGTVRLGQGVNLYLATVLNVPAGRAMGFSLLARMLLVVKSFAVGLFCLESPVGLLAVDVGIMAVTMACLLLRKGYPLLVANAFSTVTFLKASYLFFLPASAAKQFFGVDVSIETIIKSRRKCRFLGYHLLINAVFMNALSLGVEPIKAAGMSSLTWVALLLEFTFVSGKYTSLRSIPRAYLCFLGVAVVSTLAFLALKGDAVRGKDGFAASTVWHGTDSSGVVWCHEDIPVRWYDCSSPLDPPPLTERRARKKHTGLPHG